MAIIANEPMSIPAALSHTPNDDQFAAYVTNITYFGWQSCREVMQLQFKKNDRGIWYSFSPDLLEGIIECMTWIERSVRSGDTIFHKTNPARPFFFVEPSSFWKECEMRKNAFTMFLRVAHNYASQSPEERNIRKAIRSYPYSRDTQPAIERFLFGFTRYTGKQPAPSSHTSTYVKEGWHNTFGLKDAAFVKELLKAPL